MDETRLNTIEQIQEFLQASSQIEFSAHGSDGERYAHIGRVLKRFDYPRCAKRERGVLLAYMRHTSGYSRAQLTRLIARWHNNRLADVPLAKRYSAPATPFARKYTSADVALLVEMDKANEDVCGPAIAHLLKRAFTVYGDRRYERLAELSVSHLYNLRKSTPYQAQRTSFTKTRPVCNPIGVRRAPRRNGRAGYVRIDSVHQGDPKGKVIKRYLHKDVQTPLARLAALSEQGLVGFKKGPLAAGIAGPSACANGSCRRAGNAKGQGCLVRLVQPAQRKPPGLKIWLALCQQAAEMHPRPVRGNGCVLRQGGGPPAAWQGP